MVAGENLDLIWARELKTGLDCLTGRLLVSVSLAVILSDLRDQCVSGSIK